MPIPRQDECVSPMIRLATEQDTPQLLPLMRALAEFEHYLGVFAVDEDVLREQGFRKDPPDFHTPVAEVDETLVGMLVYYFVSFTATARPTLYIRELYVTEEARGQHVGEHLMRGAARNATARGCGSVRRTVADWNTSGQRFYER